MEVFDALAQRWGACDSVGYSIPSYTWVTPPHRGNLESRQILTETNHKSLDKLAQGNPKENLTKREFLSARKQGGLGREGRSHTLEQENYVPINLL